MNNEKFEELLMEIDSVMDKWLYKHGFTACSSGLGEGFCWYAKSDTIEYTLLVDELTDKVFENFFYNELGCNYDIGIFWMSWFHELGHSMTWCDIKNTNFKEAPIDLIEYIHCPREIIASKWAVEYINAHIEDVMELAREVDELRRQIYSL